MPKFPNQPYIPSYDMRMSYTSEGRQEYIGYALPNTRETTAKWIIYKMIYDSDGRMTDRIHANGTDDFVHKWSERTSLNYTPTN